MKNKIIDVFKVANRLVSITVENPDLSELRVNQFVKIGGKEYRVRSIPFFDSNPPKHLEKCKCFFCTQKRSEKGVF